MQLQMSLCEIICLIGLLKLMVIYRHQWVKSPMILIILFSELIGVMPADCVVMPFLTIDNFPLSALITASIATSGMGSPFSL